MPRFGVEIPDLSYFERLIACRHACPVHTDASGYVQAVAEGDYALAYRIARGPNPFASICGRVCGAPCERACRRGKIDRPVSIHPLRDRQGMPLMWQFERGDQTRGRPRREAVVAGGFW